MIVLVLEWDRDKVGYTTLSRCLVERHWSRIIPREEYSSRFRDSSIPRKLRYSVVTSQQLVFSCCLHMAFEGEWRERSEVGSGVWRSVAPAPRVSLAPAMAKASTGEQGLDKGGSGICKGACGRLGWHDSSASGPDDAACGPSHRRAQRRWRHLWPRPWASLAPATAVYGLGRR